MAPTTILGQKTTTTPRGRDSKVEGYPLRISEMLSTLEGPRYIARVSTDSPKNILSAKRVIMKAFQNQIEGRGFSFVEVLSSCPTDWGMSPKESVGWIRDVLMKVFPLGVFKDV